MREYSPKAKSFVWAAFIINASDLSFPFIVISFLEHAEKNVPLRLLARASAIFVSVVK